MKTYSFLLLISLSLTAFSQIGGKTTFALLDLGFNARSIGLGIDFITAKDKDLNLGVSNPSLYNASQSNSMGVNQALLAGGITYGMVSYARNFDKIGTTVANLRYVNYGTMERRDINGSLLGTFTPSEYILGVGIGRKLDPRISIGANFNLIYSQLESFNAFGASVDLAGTYELEDINLLVTALVKNAGVQFKSYTKKNRAPLPAEFQLGIAYKLKHAPFRFSLLAHHLNTWDLTYQTPGLKPTIDPLTGDTIPVKIPGFGEKMAQHLTYQLEILISKNIHIRTAFDYHRRQELKLSERPGVAGFSFGVGFYFKKITIDYGISIFSRAGTLNMLSLTTNFDQWKK
jgi:hypothetical protein